MSYLNGKRIGAYLNGKRVAGYVNGKRVFGWKNSVVNTICESVTPNDSVTDCGFGVFNYYGYYDRMLREDDITNYYVDVKDEGSYLDYSFGGSANIAFKSRILPAILSNSSDVGIVFGGYACMENTSTPILSRTVLMQVGTFQNIDVDLFSIHSDSLSSPFILKMNNQNVATASNVNFTPNNIYLSSKYNHIYVDVFVRTAASAMIVSVRAGTTKNMVSSVLRY